MAGNAESRGLTAAEVIERIANAPGAAPGKAWAPQTIKTLLSRLCAKQAVIDEPLSSGPGAGKAFVYRPLVERRDLVKAESQPFLSRMFGNKAGLSLMLANLIEPGNTGEGPAGEPVAGRGRGSGAGQASAGLTREEIEACRRLLDEAERAIDRAGGPAGASSNVGRQRRNGA